MTLKDLPGRLLRFDLLLVEERALTRQVLDMPPGDPDLHLLEAWREAGLRVACHNLRLIGAVMRDPALRGEGMDLLERELASRRRYRAVTQEMADRATARIRAAAKPKPKVDLDEAAE